MFFPNDFSQFFSTLEVRDLLLSADKIYFVIMAVVLWFLSGFLTTGAGRRDPNALSKAFAEITEMVSEEGIFFDRLIEAADVTYYLMKVAYYPFSHLPVVGMLFFALVSIVIWPFCFLAGMVAAVLPQRIPVNPANWIWQLPFYIVRILNSTPDTVITIAVVKYAVRSLMKKNKPLERNLSIGIFWIMALVKILAIYACSYLI